MANLINKFLEKTKLKSSKLYYLIQYYRQISSLKPNLNNPKYKEILTALDEDGIYVIPNFFTKEQCDLILNDLDKTFAEVKNGTFKGQFQYDENKLIRIGNVNEVVNSTNLFFNNPFFDELAKSYIDPKAYSYRKEAELRDNLSIDFQQADTPHFDDWRLRFKFFLYLTDVEIENAPFTYYKYTHKNEPWKKRKNFEFERDGEFGSYGHFHPQEIKKINSIRNIEEFVCTGKAGTLIIADFRGIHRGTPLKSGRRILLNSTYGI